MDAILYQMLTVQRTLNYINAQDVSDIKHLMIIYLVYELPHHQPKPLHCHQD